MGETFVIITGLFVHRKEKKTTMEKRVHEGGQEKGHLNLKGTEIKKWDVKPGRDTAFAISSSEEVETRMVARESMIRQKFAMICFNRKRGENRGEIYKGGGRGSQGGVLAT